MDNEKKDVENTKQDVKQDVKDDKNVDNSSFSTSLDKNKGIKKDETSEVDKLKYDVEHWKNEYYRAYADMANLRKTMERDQQVANKYRIEGFVQNLLGVLDSFDMAFKAEATNEELKNYLIGFQYVHKQFLQVITDEGVVEICPKIGDKFDVNNMHAIDVVEDPGEENVVKSVTLKGYRLYERLIRPAMVVVTKHPAKKDEEKDVVETNKVVDVKDVKNDANIEKKVC